MSADFYGKVFYGVTFAEDVNLYTYITIAYPNVDPDDVEDAIVDEDSLANLFDYERVQFVRVVTNTGQQCGFAVRETVHTHDLNTDGNGLLSLSTPKNEAALQEMQEFYISLELPKRYKPRWHVAFETSF